MNKKQSLVRRVAFILGTYEGGTVEENLPLAKYVVAYIKRNRPAYCQCLIHHLDDVKYCYRCGKKIDRRQ